MEKRERWRKEKGERQKQKREGEERQKRKEVDGREEMLDDCEYSGIEDGEEREKRLEMILDKEGEKKGYEERV